MAENEAFEGWVAFDKDSINGEMRWQSYEPKPFEDFDVDIAVTHCGVCGSDLSHLRSGWKPADYPIIAGHELVGHAVRVGSRVKHIAIGDRAGVGAQCLSCLREDCSRCSRDMEHHCAHGKVITYDDRWPDGSKAYGGWSKRWRGSAEFAFKIPDGLPSELAAPMLCGGSTAYTPLRENGAGPGKRVGIIGIGGIGCFGILFAKALKCDNVVAISRTSAKKEDAMKMGADMFIATEEETDYHTKYKDSLDLIICTSSGSALPMAQYLSLLDVQGMMVLVGAPEDPIPSFNVFALLRKNVKIGGSLTGSRKMIREMLQFAEKEQITSSWIVKRPMADANKVVRDMDEGKARYRYVLVNE